MKRLLITAALLGLVACGSPAAPAPTPTPAPKTVNDVVLTATQLSVPLTTYDVGPYPVQSVLVGNSIYFGNYSNTGNAQFFVRYSIPSNTFSSPLTVSANVCGCGYTSKLVSDGVNIFYIANAATKYTASANTWTALTYPATAHDNAGEAGVTYYNGNIYYVGGRTASTLFKYYSISQDSWFTVPNYLYATSSSEVVNFKDRIYVMGGTGATNKMAYFSTTTSTWTAVKDTPVTVSTSYETAYSAALGNYIYLLQDDSIYVYDPAADAWGSAPTKVTGLPGYATLLSDGQNLYIAGKNASSIPAVFKVTVSMK